jgi:hypothetical protein
LRGRGNAASVGCTALSFGRFQRIWKLRPNQKVRNGKSHREVEGLLMGAMTGFPNDEFFFQMIVQYAATQDVFRHLEQEEYILNGSFISKTSKASHHFLNSLNSKI